MAILDQLAVELSLDPKKFIEGLKKTLEESQKGQQQIIKNAQAIEDQTKKSADSVSKLSREFVTFFGVIGGAFGVNAIKSLVEHMSTADAAIGRMAANIGTTPQALSAWGYAVERLGGNAQAAQASISGLFEKVFRFTNFGTPLSNEFWIGLSRGGVKSDFLRTKDPTEQMFQIGRAIQNVAAREGRPSAYGFAKTSFGLDEGSANLIIQSKTEADLRANLAKIVKGLSPTDKDVANAAKLQEQWAILLQHVEALARLSYEPITKFLDKLTAFVKVISGETTAVEANRETSDNPDSYISPHAFARYYNRLAKKNHYLHRMWDGTFGNSWLGRGLGYGREPDYSPSAGGSSAESSSAVNPESSAASPVTGAAPEGRRPVAQAIADEWRREGMSEAGIAGIMANVQSESAFNSGLRHPDQPNWGGEAHFAHGLYQEGGAEWNNYAAWLQKNYPGSDWRDARLQSRFAAWNLRTNYPGVWARMNASTKEGAAQAYVSGYLKPAKGFEIARRAQYGRGVPGVEHYTGPRDQTPYSAAGVDWSLYGSSFAPRTSATSNYSQSTSSMFLNGPITVNTQATNADGFARDLRPAIEAQTSTFMANDGAN